MNTNFETTFEYGIHIIAINAITGEVVKDTEKWYDSYEEAQRRGQWWQNALDRLRTRKGKVTYLMRLTMEGESL